MGSENPFSCCPVSTPYLRDLGFFDTTESDFKSHPCPRKSLKLFLLPSPTSFRKIDERKSLLNGDFPKKCPIKHPLPPPFAMHILNHLEMMIHQVPPFMYHTYSKNWVIVFLVISEVGRPDYTAKTLPKAQKLGSYLKFHRNLDQTSISEFRLSINLKISIKHQHLD